MREQRRCAPPPRARQRELTAPFPASPCHGAAVPRAAAEVVDFADVVNEDGRAHTEYFMVVRSGDGSDWEVSHRYSHFRALFEELGEVYPAVAAFRFPNKSRFSTFADRTKQRRMTGFQEFLDLLLGLHPRPRELDRFLGNGEQGLGPPGGYGDDGPGLPLDEDGDDEDGAPGGGSAAVPRGGSSAVGGSVGAGAAAPPQVRVAKRARPGAGRAGQASSAALVRRFIVSCAIAVLLGLFFTTRERAGAPPVISGVEEDAARAPETVEADLRTAGAAAAAEGGATEEPFVVLPDGAVGGPGEGESGGEGGGEGGHDGGEGEEEEGGNVEEGAEEEEADGDPEEGGGGNGEGGGDL